MIYLIDLKFLFYEKFTCTDIALFISVTTFGVESMTMFYNRTVQPVWFYGCISML